MLEEGVDVRQCNVVIRFDRPKDYRSFVQSKGRARKENSSYFALVEERDSPAFTQDLRDFEQIEQVVDWWRWLNQNTLLTCPSTLDFDFRVQFWLMINMIKPRLNLGRTLGRC